MKRLSILLPLVLFLCLVGAAFAESDKDFNMEEFVASVKDIQTGDQFAAKEDYLEALRWYEKAASYGNATAQFRIGKLYYAGLGVQQDFFEAFSFFQKAASYGDVNAQYFLGEMYENGKGVGQSLSKAFEEYRKAAAMNHPDASFKVGWYLQHGYAGVEKNEKFAVGWYRRATKSGNADAMVALGDLCLADENFKGARIWFKRAAEKGNVEAQYRLGMFFEKGLEGRKDIDSANTWYAKAAAAGHAKAQERLDNMNSNIGEALKSDRAAANIGDAKAMYNLGVAYSKGLGVPVDFIEANKWFMKSAQAEGDESRVYNLTLHQMLYRGDYQSLENFARNLRRDKTRLSNQRWKLEQFYHYVSQPVDATKTSETDWRYLNDKLNAWVSAFPGSITARVALAQYLVNDAWKARGRGGARSVSEESWKQFHDLLSEAEKVLAIAGELNEDCPHRYAVMLKVAFSQGWKFERFNALFKEAISFEPNYLEYYFRKTIYLSPKWYGDLESQLMFAAEVEQLIGGRQGLAIFSRIFWYACSLSGNAYKFMQRNKALWPKIKEGYRAREELYGEGISDLNQLAYMARYVGDMEQSRSLFHRIGENWDETVFGTKSNFENVRKEAFE